MAINRVDYNGRTLIDLTADTLTQSDQMLNGVKAHTKSGTQITGSLVVQNYYSGTSDPAASLGSNGDLYMKLEA